jgi:hypothetical protein
MKIVDLSRELHHRALPIKTTDEFGAYARRIYASLGLGAGGRAGGLLLGGGAENIARIELFRIDPGARHHKPWTQPRYRIT